MFSRTSPSRTAAGARRSRRPRVTHVIGVEALAHARGHVEPALQRTEPHRVGNVAAEESQGPEPREKGAGGTFARSPLHRGRRWLPRASSPWETARPDPSERLVRYNHRPALPAP